MRKVKALFDPDGRFNPGVMVDAAPLTDGPARPRAAARARRCGPTSPSPSTAACAAPPTAASASAPAARPATGVMCPSYMATREEEHATRGRANALVKALSEPDPRAALGDERLHEILDLCLECKACKSECPLSVDMATMKSEFLSHYQAQHGDAAALAAVRRDPAAQPARRRRPRRSRTSRVPRALLERVAGIDRRRPLPRFARETLLRWDRRRARPRAGSRGDVVFLADSFTTFTEPAIGRAAIELLEAAGWSVRLESAGCCGRSSISKGLLDQARGMAEAMVARLAPEAERGVPIVGCEPSCLLTLREEHRRPAARRPARAGRGGPDAAGRGAARRGDRRRRAGARRRRRRQRAARSSSTATATRRRSPAPPRRSRCSSASPAREVTELDAGCCGMAGSFGFEAEHYDLSMQIGESAAVPGAARGSGRDPGRRHRRVVPSADRPRRGAARLASCRAREELRVIRWGIISTGGIASTFASELAQTDSGSAVAVGSRRAASAEAFGERFGIPRRHDCYEALVADPEVDAIYVAHAAPDAPRGRAARPERRQARAVREAVHDQRRRGRGARRRGARSAACS